MSLIYNLAKC